MGLAHEMKKQDWRAGDDGKYGPQQHPHRLDPGGNQSRIRDSVNWVAAGRVTALPAA